MLGNPVPGHIQARGETWNRTGFIVTSTFAEHKASGRALGVDVGNGRQGAAVYAMAAGAVANAGYLGAALVVRINHPGLSSSFGGAAVQSGYAHLQTITVKLGQVVPKGYQIGTVGMTGADAPHLHGGFTVAGVERDWWPLLDQNITQGDAVPIIPTALFSHVINRKSSLKAATGLRGNPSGASTSPVLRTYAAGTAFFPIVKVTYPTAEDWYGCWLYDDSPAGYTFGYFPESACTALEVNENPPDPAAPVPPATQDQIDDAYNAGRQAVLAAAASVPPK